MDPETKQKLEEIDAKLLTIYTSVEKTRKYFLVAMWVTIIAVVLPVLGLLLVIPSFLQSYSASFEGLL